MPGSFKLLIPISSHPDMMGSIEFTQRSLWDERGTPFLTSGAGIPACQH